MGKNGIKLLLKEQLELEDKIWNQINLMWVGFFFAMGILNLLIAFNFSEADWVNFKVFGGFGLMLVWTLLTGLYVYAKSKGKINNG
jgi:intracellular septation protein